MSDNGATAGPAPGPAQTKSLELEALRHELERLRLEVVRDEKLKSLGTLAGGMAHDINNILTSISCFASLALVDMSHPDATDALGQILRAVERGRGIAGEVLEIIRPCRIARAAVSLGAVVRETLGLLRPMVPAGVDLVFRPPAGRDLVFGSATQLHQVLLNLCQNAIHAMHETPGRIVVAVDAVDIGETSDGELAGLRPGPHVRLSVSDEGRGMDAATRRRIFEPLFTTKPEGRGTGLGLAVVHRVVRDHAGAIQVASEPGKGSTFRIYLPALAESHPGPREQNSPAAG